MVETAVVDCAPAWASGATWAAVGVSDTGFALTANEVLPDARAGAQATTAVSTMGCD